MEINVSGWLVTPYEQNSMVWLIITAIVSLIFGFLASWLSFHFIRKPELIEQLAQEIKKYDQTLDIDEEHKKEERINQEIIKWSNPILIAVNELNDRLKNILKRAYKALDEDFMPFPRWPMTYDYFMTSTLYIFGQYFAWIRMMEEGISYEIFSSSELKTELFENIQKCREALASTEYVNHSACVTDRQVYRHQQRAIGELFIVGGNDKKRCLTYPEFCKKMKDEEFKYHMYPLKAFLEGIHPNETGYPADCRWNRLDIMQKDLEKLQLTCEKLLKIKHR